jgi:hypothetical protein
LKRYQNVTEIIKMLVRYSVRITIDQQRAEVSTKRVCDPKRWNSHTGRLNGTKEEARTINAYLDTLQSKVYEAYRSLIESNDLVSADATRCAIQSLLK